MKRFFILYFFLAFGVTFLFAQDNSQPPIAPFEKGQLFSRGFVAKPVGAEVRKQKFDAQYYRLYFKLDIPHRKIYAHAHERFKSLQEELNTITLDFNAELHIDSVGGSAVNYTRNGDFLDLTLNKSYAPADTFSVDIYYSGNPQRVDAISFVFDYTPDYDLYVWTLSEPYGARDWWPCKDTPADKADSADIVVAVPKNNIVASNGLLVKEQEGPESGWHTFFWHEGYPIATYLISIVAGPLAHFQDYYHYSATDSMLLDYYVLPIDLYNAQKYFEEVPDYLDALSHFFGPYPFLKEKYGMAQFGWRGGMEHQTITSIGGVYKSWRFLYVHELGHQWFGDKVTCASWRDIWLNEGFATYSEALYAQWAGFNEFGPGMEAYHAYMNGLFYDGDGTVIIADTTDFTKIFDPIVYHKGAWILHMLRHVMGDDAFFRSLKTYLNDPRWTYGSVRTKDFITTCESVSGLNLDSFFDQWLNYPFFPKYEYEWIVTRKEAGETLVKVTIKQTQDQTLYVMPLDIQFVYADKRDTLITVQNDHFTQTYNFHLKQEPVQMILDPDHWVLNENKESTPASYTQFAEIYRIYPNPSHGDVNIEIRHLLDKEVTLEIFNIQGQLIRKLKPASNQFYLHTYHWDGKNENGQAVASGVYIVRTVAPAVPQRQEKIVILR